MPTTVALLGASGWLGSNILSALAKRLDSGEIKLVILHREGSKLKDVPDNVETRVLDSDNADEAAVSKALEGVEVLIAAGKSTPEGALKFAGNLAKVAKSSSTFKVFVPSFFTANWAESEATDKRNAYTYGKCVALQKTIELGVPTTSIRNGLFEESFLDPGFFGLNASANTIQVYGNAEYQNFSFVSLPFLAEAVAQIITSKDFGPGKEYTVIEQEFTAADVAHAFEQVNGRSPTVTKFTDEDVEAARKESGVAGLGAAWRMHWGNGNFKVVNRFEPIGFRKRNLADAVNSAKLRMDVHY